MLVLAGEESMLKRRNGVNYGFWTEEKQEELWIFVSPNPTKFYKQKAAKRFKKSLYEIVMVYSAISKRKQHACTTYVNEIGIKVTVFAPAYAYGAEPRNNVRY